MHTADPIAALLLGRIRLAVLGTLLEDPGRDFYMRELAAQIGMVPGAIQRELKVLAEVGLITRRRRGHQVYYKANDECTVFNDIRNLIIKTAGIAGAIRRAISPLASDITYAAIYGSLATGKLSPGSDVDLLIVGDLSMEDVIVALREVENLTGREINPNIYSPQEFDQQLQRPDSFLSTVLQTPRVELIGNAQRSGSLGAGRLDSSGQTEPQTDTKTAGKGRKRPHPRRGTHG